MGCGCMCGWGLRHRRQPRLRLHVGRGLRHRRQPGLRQRRRRGEPAAGAARRRGCADRTVPGIGVSSRGGGAVPARSRPAAGFARVIVIFGGSPGSAADVRGRGLDPLGRRRAAVAAAPTSRVASAVDSSAARGRRVPRPSWRARRRSAVGARRRLVGRPAAATSARGGGHGRSRPSRGRAAERSMRS